jgi:hypothetical protein
MADLTLKRHDTFPTIKMVLEQVNEETGKKEAVDLTAALKVTLIMKSGSTVLEIPCTIAKAKEGKIEAQLLAEDTATTGTWKAEVEVEWPEVGGKKQLETFPNESYKEIVIIEDLGAV